MSCPVSSNLEFPGYLKNLLKSIENGSDDNLKDCACALHILTENGCISLDEDGKMGAFPFCVEEASYGDEHRKPGFTQKNIMQFFWRTKSIKAVAGTTEYKINQSLPREGVSDQKQLVCAQNNNSAGKFDLDAYIYLYSIKWLKIRFPIYKNNKKFYFRTFEAAFVERTVDPCYGCYPSCCPCWASAYLVGPDSLHPIHNVNKILESDMMWAHLACQDTGANFTLTPEFWA